MNMDEFLGFQDEGTDGWSAGPRYFPLTKEEYDKITNYKTVDPIITDVSIKENGMVSVRPQGFDAISGVDILVDVAGGGGGDYSKWEIGDVVLYDNVEDKKVKSTRGDYNLDKFPLDRFTPEGVVAFVLEDGSARMLALTAMNTNTPDTGDVTNQYIYWGNSSTDIPELENFVSGACIDVKTGEVNGFSSNPYIPSDGDQFGGKLSLDETRVYYKDSGWFTASPYNEDGALNPLFTQKTLTPTVTYYCWSRTSGSSTYYMYTDTEEISEVTELLCGSMGNNSQVKNYGNTSKIGGSYAATRLGSILDESVFDGGVEGFTTAFTRSQENDYAPREVMTSCMSDMDGKANTTAILTHVTVEDWQTIDQIPNSSSEGNYPAACCCWRFHTVNTEQGDWYLPAIGELAILISNFSEIQHTLKAVKKTSQVPVACLSTGNSYWSSSEISSDDAWYCSNYGYLNNNGRKGNNSFVRALCAVSALS